MNITKTMQKLTKYKSSGYEYNLMERRGNVGIFKEYKHDSYEVIIIQSHNGLEFNGVKTAPTEYPPGKNQWGSKGWTFRERDAAYEKFIELAK